jgi:Ser-tRNA(Ala) deacylase AlaX
MTISYFYEDPYCREITARITNLSGNQVELERSIFYPAGGGQPGDTGVLVEWVRHLLPRYSHRFIGI